MNEKRSTLNFKTLLISDDSEIVIWFHNGTHGHKGYVTREGEWEAIMTSVSPNGDHFFSGQKTERKIIQGG